MEARAGLITGIAGSAVNTGKDYLADARVEVGEHVHGLCNVLAELIVFGQWIWDNCPEVPNKDTNSYDSKSVGEDYIWRVDHKSGF